MKLIMENWRKWNSLREIKDFPADGVKPIEQEVYDIHLGGETGQLPLTPLKGAPLKDRPAIQYLAPNAEEILDPETGKIDGEKLKNYIDYAKSAWGPEGDPERDEFIEAVSRAMRLAIENLKERSPKNEISPDLEMRAQEVQRKLRDRFPDVSISWFYDEPGMEFAGYL